MKAVFIGKKGKTKFTALSRNPGEVHIEIVDLGKEIIKEIDTETVYQVGESIYFEDLDKAPKIESVARTLDGGYRYEMDYYIELQDDHLEYERAVDASIRLYEKLNESIPAESVRRIKELWNKITKRK